MNLWHPKAAGCWLHKARSWATVGEIFQATAGRLVGTLDRKLKTTSPSRTPPAMMRIGRSTFLLPAQRHLQPPHRLGVFVGVCEKMAVHAKGHVDSLNALNSGVVSSRQITNKLFHRLPPVARINDRGCGVVVQPVDDVPEGLVGVVSRGQA